MNRFDNEKFDFTEKDMELMDKISRIVFKECKNNIVHFVIHSKKFACSIDKNDKNFELNMSLHALALICSLMQDNIIILKKNDPRSP